MGNETRRAKVTPETKAEARKLLELWNSHAHPSQAEFGEMYGVGNQSAVGQFLRGDTPLSLKAARGFAKGLGVRLEDFSPRLAAEAAEIAGIVPQGTLSPEVADIASAINQLPKRQRDWVLSTVREAVSLAQETIGVNAKGVSGTTHASQNAEVSAPLRRKKTG